jgi:hypothetical protein
VILPDFEPKILVFCCNSAFFFWAKFSAVVENIVVDAKYVFHYIVEDSHRFYLNPVHHDGSGSQRETWGKKKLALPCSIFASSSSAGAIIKIEPLKGFEPLTC